jgi:hypothetical protein
MRLEPPNPALMSAPTHFQHHLQLHTASTGGPLLFSSTLLNFLDGDVYDTILSLVRLSPRPPSRDRCRAAAIS